MADAAISPERTGYAGEGIGRTANQRHVEELGDARPMLPRAYAYLDQPCRGERCDPHIGFEIAKGAEEMALAGTEIERVETIHRWTGTDRIEELTKEFRRVARGSHEAAEHRRRRIASCRVHERVPLLIRRSHRRGSSNAPRARAFRTSGLPASRRGMPFDTTGSPSLRSSPRTNGSVRRMSPNRREVRSEPRVANRSAAQGQLRRGHLGSVGGPNVWKRKRSARLSRSTIDVMSRVSLPPVRSTRCESPGRLRALRTVSASSS